MRASHIKPKTKTKIPRLQDISTENTGHEASANEPPTQTAATKRCEGHLSLVILTILAKADTIAKVIARGVVTRGAFDGTRELTSGHTSSTTS